MKQRPEYDPKIIGMNLRRLREEKHLTVEQVREYLCLGSVQAIYKYETGVGYPQADTMLALMELYEAGVNEIVKLNSEEHSSSVSIFCAKIRRLFRSAAVAERFVGDYPCAYQSQRQHQDDEQGRNEPIGRDIKGHSPQVVNATV